MGYRPTENFESVKVKLLIKFAWYTNSSVRNVLAPLLQNSYSEPSITLNEAGGPRTIISNVSSVKSFPLFNVIFAYDKNRTCLGDVC